MKHLGLFLPNWVGDAVMVTPALRALRRHFGPQARLVGVMRPAVADTLAGTDWIDQRLIYDPHHPGPAVLSSRQVVRALREQRVETVVLFTHSFRTALLAWLSGARRRIGFVRDGRGWLLTDRLQPVQRNGTRIPSPVLDDYLQLTSHLGCAPERPRLELATLAADECAADALWSALGLAPAERVVALNSSGAFGPAKLWPSESFAQLARHLADRHGVPVLVLCGPAERELARAIAQQAAHPRVFSLADRPVSLGLTKACIRRSRLLVTTDSGPRHFAAAFGVPVVTLFGPTDPAWSETHYPLAAHLQHPVPCGPCQQRVCPQGHHRCMRELSVEQVAAVADRLLTGRLFRAA